LGGLLGAWHWPVNPLGCFSLIALPVMHQRCNKGSLGGIIPFLQNWHALGTHQWQKCEMGFSMNADFAQQQ
jgi:hypothetical protein